MCYPHHPSHVLSLQRTLLNTNAPNMLSLIKTFPPQFWMRFRVEIPAYQANSQFKFKNIIPKRGESYWEKRLILSMLECPPPDSFRHHNTERSRYRRYSLHGFHVANLPIPHIFRRSEPSAHVNYTENFPNLIASSTCHHVHQQGAIQRVAPGPCTK